MLENELLSLHVGYTYLHNRQKSQNQDDMPTKDAAHDFNTCC